MFGGVSPVRSRRERYGSTNIKNAAHLNLLLKKVRGVPPCLNIEVRPKVSLVREAISQNHKFLLVHLLKDLDPDFVKARSRFRFLSGILDLHKRISVLDEGTKGNLSIIKKELNKASDMIDMLIKEKINFTQLVVEDCEYLDVLIFPFARSTGSLLCTIKEREQAQEEILNKIKDIIIKIISQVDITPVINRYKKYKNRPPYRPRIIEFFDRPPSSEGYLPGIIEFLYSEYDKHNQRGFYEFANQVINLKIQNSNPNSIKESFAKSEILDAPNLLIMIDTFVYRPFSTKPVKKISDEKTENPSQNKSGNCIIM